MPATESRTPVPGTEGRTLMQRIVATSLRFRWIVLFLAAATLAVGFVQIPETKVDVFPEFAPPRVEIQTIALGNSSNEVEELITVPIENQLNGIEGLEDLRSKSVAQLSSIQLFFSRAPTSFAPGSWLPSGSPRSRPPCPPGQVRRS